MDYMTLSVAAEIYGVQHSTIRRRLWTDQKKENDLMGSLNQGGTWVVSKKYMDAKWGKGRSHEEQGD